MTGGAGRERDDDPTEPLLAVENLEKHYPITEGLLNREVGRVRAVDGISFEIRRGETVGLIGESGCGKSTAAASITRLEEPTGGEVRFDGDPVGEYDDAAVTAFRRRVGMIFQDPTGSFDPRLSVGESIAEFLTVHGVDDRATRRAVVEDLLPRVGLSESTYDRYPHELSGGQKQRAALARALVLDPELLVADEPVSALDVSVQAEILTLLAELQAAYGLSMLVISHDIDVVREICDRINVMYLGRIVESGPTEAVLSDPRHPYTQALVASAPTPDPHAPAREIVLSGEVPDAASPPRGCSFHPRCPAVIPGETDGLTEEAWHAVFAFRLALRRVTSDGGDPADLVDAADPSPDTLRSAFDLPEAGESPSPLAEGIEAAADGDVERALSTLSTFDSPCERTDPERRESPDGRPVACLHVGSDDEPGDTSAAEPVDES